jgi:hypothetical protein
MAWKRPMPYKGAKGRMVLQRETGYVHAVEGLSLLAQLVEVETSEGEIWGCSKTAETAAVRRKQNENEHFEPAGVC